MNQDDQNTISIPLGIEGEYQLTIHRTNGEGEIIESEIAVDWFKNAIVDNGLNYLATGTIPCAYACIGSGSTPVANGDNALANFTANTFNKPTSTVFSNNTTVAPYYMEATFTYRFAAVGVARNVSEVGLQTNSASSGANGNLFSRALVVDGGGTPITISVQAGEILDVTYRYRIYPPAADITGVMSWTVAGVPTNYNYTARAVSLGGTYWQMDFTGNANFRPQFDSGTPSFRGFAKNGVLDSVTGNGITTGTASYQWTNATFAAYVSGNFYLDCSFIIGASFGTGINYNTFCTMFGSGVNAALCLQARLDAGTVTKNANQQLAFNVRFSWARMP